jgi:hypothetical protein
VQHRPQTGRQAGINDGEQTPDRRADQGDGVHGGDRVIQRCGVQHPPPPDQPRVAGGGEGHLEDPVRPVRAAQPLPQIDQHCMREPGPAGPVPATHSGGVPPADVEREPVGRLPVRQPLQTLQEHHRGNHRRRHRPAADCREQVGEHTVREQRLPMLVQEPEDRIRRQ